MHELPAVEDMIRALDEESESRGISKIKEVHLVIGELSSYVGECVQMYFDILSEGHSCENAKLYFTHTKARFKCRDCGHEFDHGVDFVCPLCKGEGRLIKGTGKEFLIRKLVYDDTVS
ncbi:MAG: hydrogenase maturation nickel metallochaperone HypA [Lachnospiraceae bacterium]|nr:hydrogenase maturation nickel metallochaperone HypA [Lachnospiraceae bacterium]